MKKLVLSGRTDLKMKEPSGSAFTPAKQRRFFEALRDMVASVLRQVDPGLPVRPVRARYGKGQRAEPVALLFEQGRARFGGCFPELEDELCGLIRGGGYEGPGRSPDRADACVWALAELTQGRRSEPRVVGL